MRIFLLFFIVILSSCVNTGHIISGELVANNTKIDLTGKKIILNEDCSPYKIDFDIPYCGKKGIDIKKGEICSVNPDEHQLGYIIFQVINDKDALICQASIYGGCAGEVEYVKNLGKGYEFLVDGYGIKDSELLRTGTYSYDTFLGKKTVIAYEYISKANFNKVKYKPNNIEKCNKSEYSYSMKYKEDWKED